MTLEAETLPPAYNHSSTTLSQVPSYTAATVTSCPAPPCFLVVKNLDRSKDPLLLVDPEADGKVVFELAQLVHTRYGSFDETLYQNLVCNGEFTAISKVFVAADRKTPYALRKHVASSTYEIIELAEDGSLGKCTKIQTKGIFKNKYHLETHPASGSPSPERKAGDGEIYLKGALKSGNATIRHVLNGNKTTLVELTKGVHRTEAQFLPLPAEAASSISIPFLVAALYAALDTHREHIHTFTTDEKLGELQAKVRPSTWDSIFLQAGQTSKKQKDFAQQLETERKREYNEAVYGNGRGPFNNGMIPAQRSSSHSRSRSASHSRNNSRTASPATFNRSHLPKTSALAEGDAEEEQRGRR